MTQDAATRPIPSTHRKAAVAHGRAADHTGRVRIEPIENFDLDRTIFNTLEGAAARYVIQSRIAKEPEFESHAAREIEAAYQRMLQSKPLPEVDPALLEFMVDECDFDVEHADGSFLDHLYFGFEYSHHHFADHSPFVMLLHSILGTGTNTFAMTADKIPALRALMDAEDWKHVEAFPSILRLLYDLPLRRELDANRHRLGQLEQISFRRVIDNEPIVMTGDDLFVQLNYQLIHLVDFLPVANWVTHANDTAFIVFRDLYDLLDRSGRLMAKIDYTPARGLRLPKGEKLSVGGWLATLIPVPLSERMASQSVRRFSESIGHDISYSIRWA